MGWTDLAGRFFDWRTTTTFFSRRDAESAECFDARAGIVAAERLSAALALFYGWGDRATTAPGDTWDRRISNGTLYMRLPRIVTAILVLASPSCSSPVAPEVENYSGHYFFGLEDSFFIACGLDESWAVDDAGSVIRAFVDQHQEEFERAPGDPVPTGNVYAELRGRISEEGEYGHLGHHQRALTISDVAEVRLPAANDCSE